MILPKADLLFPSAGILEVPADSSNHQKYSGATLPNREYEEKQADFAYVATKSAEGFDTMADMTISKIK